MAHRPTRAFARRAAPAHRLQYAAAAFEAADARLREHLYVRKSGNAVDEIARHLRCQARAANEEPDLSHLGRQINHGLTGRVARADKRHLLPGAQLCFEGRSPIMHARAFEGFKVWDGWSPVARAAGNDDRARTGAFAVGKIEDETAVIGIARRIKTDHLVWDCHLYPKFLCLVVRASHQSHTGDAGRKSQIVLDPSRGTSLAAERAAVEDQRAEPFRSRIDSGREACRTGANDRHVIDTVGIDRPYQPDATGEFSLARIAQQLSARAQHDRQLTSVDLKALDERFGFRIGFGIEALMRMAVATKKALQTKDVAVFSRADDHRPARARLQQTYAAQNEGAHDPLAEFRLGDKQCPQSIRRDDQSLDRFACACIHQRRPAGELRQLAQELACAMGDNGCAVARLIVPGDFDAAGQDDTKPAGDFADPGQRLANLKGAHLAEPPNTLDLERPKRGEHLLAPRIDD